MQRMVSDAVHSSRMYHTFYHWLLPAPTPAIDIRVCLLSPGCWPSTIVALRSAHSNSVEFPEQSFAHGAFLPAEMQQAWSLYCAYYRSLFPTRRLYPLLHLVRVARVAAWSLVHAHTHALRATKKG